MLFCCTMNSCLIIVCSVHVMTPLFSTVKKVHPINIGNKALKPSNSDVDQKNSISINIHSIRLHSTYCEVKALSVFSLIPWLSTRHCPHLLPNVVLRRHCCWAPDIDRAHYRSISPALGGEGALSSKPLHAAAANRRTLVRFIDPFPHTMQTVSISIFMLIFGGLTAQVDWLGLRVGGHPALSLHSSTKPGELSQ